MDDDAPAAVAALLPLLGSVSGEPVRVDGMNADHPGHTFDYAVQRADGDWIAIEVVRAWDSQFLATQAAWLEHGERFAEYMRREHPAVEGRFSLTVGRSVRAREVGFGTLAEAVMQCTDGEVRTRIDVRDGVDVWCGGGGSGLRVYVAFQAGEWELGSESQARLAKALASKAQVMDRAGEAGYETHLAVIHWALGSTTGWRSYLEASPPTSTHPKHIWAVDRNEWAGSQGRALIERLWPPS